MQADKNHQELAGLLDELSSRDVAPRWRKEPTWFRLLPLLHKRGRKAIPLWSYPLAASIVALCLLFLYPRQREAPNSPGITTHRPSDGNRSLVSDAPARVTADAKFKQTTQAVATEIPRQKLARPKGQYVVRNSRPDPEKAQETNTYVTEQVIEPTLPEQQAVHRSPQATVYTLSEIMNNVPEKETPPRRYSRLFGNQHMHDAPGEPANTSMRKQLLQQGPPQIPTLITY